MIEVQDSKAQRATIKAGHGEGEGDDGAGEDDDDTV